jgi:hypothetical protein
MEGVKRQLVDLRSSVAGVGKSAMGSHGRLSFSAGLKAPGAPWSKHEALEESVRGLEMRMDREAQSSGIERAELESVRPAVDGLDIWIKEVERMGIDSCWEEEIRCTMRLLTNSRCFEIVVSLV